MTNDRVTDEGFRVIMDLLRSNEDFRRRLFSSDPADALVLDGVLSPEDARRISKMKWRHRRDVIWPIDEKLVLCSSSGY